MTTYDEAASLHTLALSSHLELDRAGRLTRAKFSGTCDACGARSPRLTAAGQVHGWHNGHVEAVAAGVSTDLYVVHADTETIRCAAGTSFRGALRAAHRLAMSTRARVTMTASAAGRNHVDKVWTVDTNGQADLLYG